MKLRDKLYLIRYKINRTIKEILEIILIRNENDFKSNRYVEGEEVFLGGKITYPDYLAFKNCKIEIFDNEIYKIGKIQDPFIIDCGANIGLSILYLKKENPSAKIIAFEADPFIFSFLNKNIKTYNLSDVELINKAIWEEDTTLNFISEGADGGRIGNNTFNKDKINEVKIEAVRLSSFINKKTDLIKIDIEGAEKNVLFEIEPKLHLVERIFIEYHSFYNTDQNLNQILDLLKRNNFRYYIHNAANASLSPFVEINLIHGMDNQLNIFAYREKTTKLNIEF